MFGGTLGLCQVEAAVVAADAGLDLVLAAFEDLVDPLMVNEVLTRDSDSVELCRLRSLQRP